MGRRRDVPHAPCPAYMASPTSSIPHQRGTYVTSNEPTGTHHCHSKSTLSFTLGVKQSTGLGKYITACTHPYGIIQSIFTILKVICALLILSKPLHTHRPLCSLLILPFSDRRTDWLFLDRITYLRVLVIQWAKNLTTAAQVTAKAQNDLALP